MAYASFRCLVDAPYPKVWQSICETAQRSPRLRSGASAIAIDNSGGQPARQKLRIQDLDLHELVSVDASKAEVTLKLDSGQALQGERRFALREDKATAKLLIECSLHWQVADQDIDRRLHRLMESLVRDIVLEMKTVSES